MKILYDHQIFLDQVYGGPSRYYMNLIKQISSDHEVKICAPIYINNYLGKADKKIKHGIKLNKKLLSLFPQKIKNITNKLIVNHFNKIYTENFIKVFNPDIIHHTYYDSKIKKVKPTVITVYDLIHEIFHKEYKKDQNYRPKKKALESADKIICISKNTASDLLKFYNVEKTKIEVVYLASELKLKSEDNNFKLFNNNYILFVGKREGYKNFNKLIKAFSVSKKLKENFKIICFGGESFKTSEKIFLNDNGLDDNNVKHMVGDDTVLKNLYKNARALIYPSIYEGFGLPILEAMQCMCPVFCSNTSSMKEIGGNATVFFNPNEIDEIIYKLELHLFDNIFLNNLKKNGLLHSANFSWKKCCDQTMKIYKELKT